MPSSLFTKAKLRLLDRGLGVARRPNRIDAAAIVSPQARITSSALYGPVRVGDYATLHSVELNGPVTIGANSSLWGPGTYVLARKHPIEIGNFCSIARAVMVHGYEHDPSRMSTYHVGRNVLGRPIEDETVSRGPTNIGHDVWIGSGAHILSGVSIGTGSIVGAGSVVSRDVPPYAIVVGTPAEVVRMRFDDDIVERLLESRWWEWGHDEIRAKEELFTGSLTTELLDRYL